MILRNLIHLIYPKLCFACHKQEPILTHCFCFNCLCQLPFTSFESFEENTCTEHFIGRLPIKIGYSLFHLVKGNSVESMIHLLKYKNRTDIGVSLGILIGDEWKLRNHYLPEIVVPVPLHKKKKRIRGYNQSEMIAKGIAQSFGNTASTNNLVRTRNTKSQTTMNRLERVHNTEDAFALRSPQEFTNKDILLVDDVLTTGATLEACGNSLLSANPRSISIATIGIGHM